MSDLIITERENLTHIANEVRKKIHKEGLIAMEEIVESITGLSDTSDATALAEDIAANKTAYVNGEKIVGTFVVPKSRKIQLDLSEDEELTAQYIYVNELTNEVTWVSNLHYSDSIEVSAVGGAIALSCQELEFSSEDYKELFGDGWWHFLVKINDNYSPIKMYTSSSQ